MPEESRQTREDRVFAISVGEQRLVGRYRPGDAESGIAPQQAAIVLGRVIGAHLVDDFLQKMFRTICWTLVTIIFLLHSIVVLQLNGAITKS